MSKRFSSFVFSFSSSDDFGITLAPQNINNITLTISDDTTNRNNGIANTIKFVICLVITEFEPEIVEYNERVKFQAAGVTMNFGD